MTKKLEEEFNLPPLDNVEVNLDETETEKTVDELNTEIQLNKANMEISERVDTALPIVDGLDQLDREMDEYATKAMSTFEDLCDLGKNVEDRHAAPIFDSASKMLSAALQAKQAKIDKKLKMIELQMRKAKLDIDERKVNAKLGTEEDTEEVEGRFVGDRSSMLNEIVARIKENDK